MAFNVINNMVALLIIGVSLIALALGVGITDTLKNQTNTTLMAADPSIGSNATYITLIQDYDNMRALIFNITSFVVVVALLFMLYSSFSERGDVMTYTVNFIGGMIVGSLVLYMLAAIYNAFSVASGNFFSLADIPSFFFNNLGMMVVMNIVAGALSIVFGGRGEGT